MGISISSQTAPSLYRLTSRRQPRPTMHTGTVPQRTLDDQLFLRRGLRHRFGDPRPQVHSQLLSSLLPSLQCRLVRLGAVGVPHDTGPLHHLFPEQVRATGISKRFSS